MKKIVINFGLICIVILAGCSKEKKNENLAKNYYQLALLELEDNPDDISAYKSALSFAHKASENSNMSEYKAFEATLLILLNQAKEACAIFKDILSAKLDPLFRSEVKNNYACALAQNGEVVKALAIWKELESDKNYLTPEVCLLNQSKIAMNQKNFIEAKKCLQKSIELDPSYTDAHFNLACLANSYLSDETLAKEEIKKVLFIDPTNQKAKTLHKEIFKEA